MVFSGVPSRVFVRGAVGVPGTFLFSPAQICAVFKVSFTSRHQGCGDLVFVISILGDVLYQARPRLVEDRMATAFVQRIKRYLAKSWHSARLASSTFSKPPLCPSAATLTFPQPARACTSPLGLCSVQHTAASEFMTTTMACMSPGFLRSFLDPFSSSPVSFLDSSSASSLSFALAALAPRLGPLGLLP